MIQMLVGDEDSADALEGESNGFSPSGQLSWTKPGIDQDSLVTVLDEVV